MFMPRSPTTPRAKAIPTTSVMEHHVSILLSELMQAEADGRPSRTDYSTPPDPVTWDWHDDTGATADVNESEDYHNSTKQTTPT